MAAFKVLAHQTMVQFCCSGVTGAIRARMVGSAFMVPNIGPVAP